MQSPYIKFSAIGISLHTVTNKQFADLKKDLQGELESNLIAALGIKNYFFLCTCNRLELYFMEEANTISNLTHNTLKDVLAHGYYKSGYEAIRHLARVASGMDSKILGDYEIVSQVKNASNEAVERGTFNSVLEKIVGFALQVSKRIRTETKISQGITSYASAAVDILQKHKKEKFLIAVVGTGEIGSQVINYLANSKKKKMRDVTVFNRTIERAKELAEAEGFQFGTLQELMASANRFDALINCADLQEDDTLKFTTSLPALLIDLTPQQVFEALVKQSVNTKYYPLDRIHHTIEGVKKEKLDHMQVYESIIDTCISEMHQNQKIRHYLPLLHRYGDILHKTTKASSSDTSHYRNLVVNHVFKKTKNSSLSGCDMISVFTESRSEKNHE